MTRAAEPPIGELHVHADADAVAEAAARRWVAIAADAIAARGVCRVALAGGATPRTLYRLMSTDPWRGRIEWGGIRFWFGDERCVPMDHPDSNYRMARETLFDALAITPAHIHRIETERGPGAAAQAYAGKLREAFGNDGGEPPRFDLVLLGLGPDGHVASLFPGTPLLEETRRWVDACRVPALDAWRVSLTFPVLNAARHVLLVVAGNGKAAILADVVGARGGAAPRYPVERLTPRGTLEWLIDEAAAARLPGGAR